MLDLGKMSSFLSLFRSCSSKNLNFHVDLPAPDFDEVLYSVVLVAAAERG